MKKHPIKIFAAIFIMTVAILLLTSCFIIEDVQCAHSSLSTNNCITKSVCEVCGVTVGDFGEHDYTTTVTPPDCTNNGRLVSVCVYCGDTHGVKAGNATGHTFGEWIITVDPTPDTAGKREHSCINCGLTLSETISPHSHRMRPVAACEADCEHEGWEEYICCTVCDYNDKVVIPPYGHDWGDYISLGNGTHLRTCGVDAEHTLLEACSGTVSEEGKCLCDFCGAQTDFFYRLGNSTYGYYAFDDYYNSDNLKKLYRDLTAVAEEFYSSEEDLTEKDGYYVIGEFNYSEYGLSIDEVSGVWKVFYISNPTYYWLDATVVSSGSTVYLTISKEYATAEYRRICDAAIERMCEESSEMLDWGMSELDRSVYIAEYVMKNLTYAYDSDGVTPVDDMWAHNMTGLAMFGYGVCESYAKSYMYLCLRNGVECLVGSGYVDEGAHAWNYFRIGDVWYGADLTWSDHSDDAIYYDFFGISSDKFFSDHTPHQSASLHIKFSYKAPALSDTDLVLTALYKNGEYVGMCKDISDAFSIMTDPEGNYEIFIGYYSSYEGAAVHHVYESKTPAVRYLAIRGVSEYVGEGYMDNNSILVIHGTLDLSSSIGLSNVYIEVAKGVTGSMIRMNNYSISLSGKSVYIEARVYGYGKNNCISASTERGAYLLGGAHVYKITINKDKVVIGADSNIYYCSMFGLYAIDDVKVQVNEFVR